MWTKSNRILKNYKNRVIARKYDEAIQAFGPSKFWIATVCRVADLVPLGGNRFLSG